MDASAHGFQNSCALARTPRRYRCDRSFEEAGVESSQGLPMLTWTTRRTPASLAAPKSRRVFSTAFAYVPWPCSKRTSTSSRARPPLRGTSRHQEDDVVDQGKLQAYYEATEREADLLQLFPLPQGQGTSAHMTRSVYRRSNIHSWRHRAPYGRNSSSPTPRACRSGFSSRCVGRKMAMIKRTKATRKPPARMYHSGHAR